MSDQPTDTPPADIPPTEKFTGPVPIPDADDILPDSGRYRPLHLHARGGMGRVFVAEDGELNRRVALKDIQARHREQPWAVPRFLFEAEVTGELEHPGVVPVYGLGRCGLGRPYYAMRFVDGTTLTDAIREFHATFDESPRSLTADQAVKFRALLNRFLAVCQTVAYAHSKGVIHRDLKPANVLLGKYGETLVIDWGLAKRLGSAERPSEAPTSGGVVGTSSGGSPPWWAPEQSPTLLGPQDERTDVYGLGAILFHILTGQSPHPSGRHPETPPGVREHAAWVDEALDEIVRTALNRNADDRPQSAGDLAGRVEAWLADQPVAAQQAAVAQLGERVATNPNDRVLVEMYARQTANLGHVYAGIGRDAVAVNVFANAAAVFADLYQQYKKARYRAEEANCLLSQSQALSRLGLADESVAVSTKAAAIYERLNAEHPGLYRAGLAELTLASPHGLVVRSGSVEGPVTIGPQDVPVPTADASSVGPGLADASDDDSPSVPDETPVEITRPAPGPLPAVGQEDTLAGEVRYTLVRKLGQGGMASVYLARDEALGRLVAVKRWLAVGVPDGVQRAELECRLTASLTHPNIVAVHATGRDSAGVPFLVMEHLPGEDLAHAISQFHTTRRVLSRDIGEYTRLITAVASAADAIGYAHRLGVLHLDPKPRNIQYGPNGEVVVFDWGLARRIGVAEATSQVPFDPEIDLQPRTGEVMGTPLYMAPEQANGFQENWDRRTDVFVLGAVLFEAVTGTRFRDSRDTAMAMLELARTEQPRRPRDIRPDVPPELDAICAKATAFRPEDRYQTADALATDLRAWLAGQPVSVYREGFARRVWRRWTGTSVLAPASASG